MACCEHRHHHHKNFFSWHCQHVHYHHQHLQLHLCGKRRLWPPARGRQGRLGRRQQWRCVVWLGARGGRGWGEDLKSRLQVTYIVHHTWFVLSRPGAPSLYQICEAWAPQGVGEGSPSPGCQNLHLLIMVLVMVIGHWSGSWSPQTLSRRAFHHSSCRRRQTSPQYPRPLQAPATPSHRGGRLSITMKVTGKFFMMWTKSSLDKACLSSLYFLALKSFGWGSVPQSIWTNISAQMYNYFSIT